jgi:hypothetical protein
MTNHVHVLLKTGLAPMATVMRRLLTGYAVTFYRAFSGTTAIMGSCFRIATSRFCKVHRVVLNTRSSTRKMSLRWKCRSNNEYRFNSFAAGP